MLSPAVAVDTASYKIFVSGKSGVGKTALVAKLAGLEVPVVHHETTGEPVLGGLPGVEAVPGPHRLGFEPAPRFPLQPGKATSPLSPHRLLPQQEK